MLDTRQLRYFVTVAEHLHFGRAADRLHIAQSALSAQVQRLEQDLGVSLLNRRKRANVSLTDAGTIFLAEAQQALRQIERAERMGRLAARGAAGRVEIGYVASAAVSGALSDLLRPFRLANPLVEVGLFAMDTPTQLRNLVDGEIDAGILRPRHKLPEGINARAIHEETAALAVPQESALATKDKVFARDLQNEQFIVPELSDGGEGFSFLLRQLGRIAGFEIEPAFKVSDFMSALSFAAAGYGVVLLPKSFVRVHIEGAVIRDIADFDIAISLILAWRKEFISPALRALLAIEES